MASLVPYISKRGVRSLNSFYFKAPYFFFKKGSKGQRKIGPVYEEKKDWPGQKREFPELSPKFMKLNPEELHNYTGVQPVGYHDEKTGKFVIVKEMVPELVVPDLSKFKLKPYVSYRTDTEIEKRKKSFLDKVKKLGSVELADMKSNEDERWPPPPMKPKTLFDLFYADTIKKDFLSRKTESKDLNK